MKDLRGWLVVAAMTILTAAACSADAPGTDDETDAFPPAISPYEPAIDPADFVDVIDNLYLPLEPGTTFVYEGISDGEKETDTVLVTHKTKEILGVTCTVVKDVVRVDGQITEKTFDWYAQDRFGNVWYFGENSHEYEDGRPVNAAGSWEAGVDGARPGIVMLGDPEVGDRYRQEFYAGEAEDFGEVLRLDASVRVPFGDYEEVLVTADSTPLEPEVLEHKFYAPGIGLVMEKKVRGGTEGFRLITIERQ
ncbi:MAG: hypothetical protein M3238_01410 [Actinomycetota bacterium]|nr:hypothetical protein [Actinomycetota bacterium]